ncbi:unnamed protein product [Pneumocystis jirovecii]|uniref:Uncharacterized protein n=1 Tax=Pneumocystis jirovecii TaxID=42068 RepID=L0PD04_PNEJI|nr:unnamed protein product [Pneumocystis jirovecii]
MVQNKDIFQKFSRLSHQSMLTFEYKSSYFLLVENVTKLYGEVTKVTVTKTTVAKILVSMVWLL